MTLQLIDLDKRTRQFMRAELEYVQARNEVVSVSWGSLLTKVTAGLRRRSKE